MCRNYDAGECVEDAGECVEDGCTNRITCQDFGDQCGEHSFNGWNSPWLEDDSDPAEAAVPGGTTYRIPIKP